MVQSLVLSVKTHKKTLLVPMIRLGIIIVLTVSVQDFNYTVVSRILHDWVNTRVNGLLRSFHYPGTSIDRQVKAQKRHHTNRGIPVLSLPYKHKGHKTFHPSFVPNYELLSKTLLVFPYNAKTFNFTGYVSVPR